jgi:hypothetical protein
MLQYPRTPESMLQYPRSPESMLQYLRAANGRRAVSAPEPAAGACVYEGSASRAEGPTGPAARQVLAGSVRARNGCPPPIPRALKGWQKARVRMCYFCHPFGALCFRGRCSGPSRDPAKTRLQAGGSFRAFGPVINAWRSNTPELRNRCSNIPKLQNRCSSILEPRMGDGQSVCSGARGRSLRL